MLEIDAQDELVRSSEDELRARREGPLFDIAAAGEVAEGAAEREARAFGAVAGVRRDLVAAERLGAADDELHAFALAPIVGRVGLLRIRCDLGLGERARQPLAQLVDAELQVHAALRRARFQAAERIALAIATVSPIAVRVLVRRRNPAAEERALPVVARATFDRAVAASAREGVRARFPRHTATRDDVDRAAGGATAVEHRATSAHDLDTLDRFERDGRELRRFELVLRDAQAVDEDQRVLVAGDAEAAQVDLLVLRAGEIADLKQPELREYVRQV